MTKQIASEQRRKKWYSTTSMGGDGTYLDKNKEEIQTCVSERDSKKVEKERKRRKRRDTKPSALE